MMGWQVLATAVGALRRNLLRSILTMLGIVIGIASVIAMMEIGSGASRQIGERISSMGSNVLMISPALYGVIDPMIPQMRQFIQTMIQSRIGNIRISRDTDDQDLFRIRIDCHQ